MSGLAEIITASVGLLIAVGGAGKFVWNKIERRFELIEADLEHCRKREKVSAQRRAGHMLAIELLLQEVQRLSPTKSRVLARVKVLLDEIAGLDDDERQEGH